MRRTLYLAALSVVHVLVASAQQPSQTNTSVPLPVAEVTEPASASGSAPAHPLARQGASALPEVPSRFHTWLDESIGPRALVVTAIPATVKIASPPDRYPPEWRQGQQGAARNFGDALASSISMQTARQSLAAVLHEDTRYRPSGRHNFFGRLSSAVADTFVYKSQGRIITPNVTNFAGAAAGGYVTRLYLPPGFNDMSHANTRMAYQFGTIVVTNVFQEFGRSLYMFSHKTHIPFIQSVPESWDAGRNRSQSR